MKRFLAFSMLGLMLILSACSKDVEVDVSEKTPATSEVGIDLVEEEKEEPIKFVDLSDEDVKQLVIAGVDEIHDVFYEFQQEWYQSEQVKNGERPDVENDEYLQRVRESMDGKLSNELMQSEAFPILIKHYTCECDGYFMFPRSYDTRFEVENQNQEEINVSLIQLGNDMDYSAYVYSIVLQLIEGSWKVSAISSTENDQLNVTFEEIESFYKPKYGEMSLIDEPTIDGESYLVAESESGLLSVKVSDGLLSPEIDEAYLTEPQGLIEETVEEIEEATPFDIHAPIMETELATGLSLDDPSTYEGDWTNYTVKGAYESVDLQMNPDGTFNVWIYEASPSARQFEDYYQESVELIDNKLQFSFNSAAHSDSRGEFIVQLTSRGVHLTKEILATSEYGNFNWDFDVILTEKVTNYLE